MNDVRAAFHAYPKDKFPIRILMFSPGGELVFDSGEVKGFAAIPVPGMGPGSVRYSLTLFGDGTTRFKDDPTCSGTVNYAHDDMDVLGRLMHFLEIVQEAGRWLVEDGSALAARIKEPEAREFFEKQADIGERFLEGAEVTRKMLEDAVNQEE